MISIDLYLHSLWLQWDRSQIEFIDGLSISSLKIHLLQTQLKIYKQIKTLQYVALLLISHRYTVINLKINTATFSVWRK